MRIGDLFVPEAGSVDGLECGLSVDEADGHRGYLQVRDAGDQIALTDDTASLHSLDLDEIRPHIPATQLIDTASLTDAEATIERITGISELATRPKKQPAATAARSTPSPLTTSTRSTTTPAKPPTKAPTTSACAAYPNSSEPPPSKASPHSVSCSPATGQTDTRPRSTASTVDNGSNQSSRAPPAGCRVSSLRCGPLRGFAGSKAG